MEVVEGGGERRRWFRGKAEKGGAEGKENKEREVLRIGG